MRSLRWNGVILSMSKILNTILDRVNIVKVNSILKINTGVDDILYDYLDSAVLDYDTLDVEYLCLEYVWRPRDIFVKTQSGYTPSIFIDLVGWTQKEKILTPVLKEKLHKISQIYNFLQLKNNGHAHDKDNVVHKIPVLNITSMAVALKSMLEQDIYDDLRFIGKAQRWDGIFPYVKPPLTSIFYDKLGRGHDFIQRNLFKDRAHSFYDISHHVMILNFLSIAHYWTEDKKEKKYISLLVDKGLKFLKFNSNFFDLEPRIYFPRYCNHSDLNAYFILIKVLRYWEKSEPNYVTHQDILKDAILNLSSEELAIGLVNNANSKWILPAQWMDPKYALIHLKEFDL